MRRYRVPAHITAPFATRLGGEWRGRKSYAAAWRAAGTYARAHPNSGPMLVVTRDGEPVPPPEEALRPSGPSGQHRSPRSCVQLPTALVSRIRDHVARNGGTLTEFVSSSVETSLEKQNR
jgi:hypothetical protein